MQPTCVTSLKNDIIVRNIYATVLVSLLVKEELNFKCMASFDIFVDPEWSPVLLTIFSSSLN